jgi:hypothetical protein
MSKVVQTRKFISMNAYTRKYFMTKAQKKLKRGNIPQ